MSTTCDTRSNVSPPIPVSVPCLGGNEWKYVRECLDTGWVSSAGSFVERFEKEVAVAAGSKFAVATVNGTSALHTALLVCGVEPADEVLVSGLTFIASANAIRYTGAVPVFVDAEPNYWQMDVELLGDFLRRVCRSVNGTLKNPVSGRRVRAIMPVHLLGHPVDLEPLMQLAREFDLKVVHDAAQSLGTRYNAKSLGEFADVACFSFNGNKTITTGGGGAIATNDRRLAERARYLTTQAKDAPDEYVHRSTGFNYRMPNVLAAIGCAQLEQLDQLVERKRCIAAHYRRLLSCLTGCRFAGESSSARATYWLSTVRMDPVQFGASCRQVRATLSEHGISSRTLWEPLHRSEVFRGCQSLNGVVAERLFDECLSLPSTATLEDNELDRICHIVSRCHGVSKAA